MYPGLFLTVVVAAWGLTWVMVLLAARLRLLDDANERSLHLGTKPRGGGVALAITLITSQIIWASKTGDAGLEIIIWWSLVFLVSIVGLIDDIIDLSAPIRLIFQIAIAVAFCLFLFDFYILHSPIGILTVCLFIVWGINAANFMDGADALLASQAFIILIVLALGDSVVISEPIRMTIISLAGGCIGFMYWNWQPSKIFLGDSGSYLIGFLIITVAFLTSKTMASLYAALILFIPLLGDATLTLGKRIITRQPIMDAHRSHLYQLMILSGMSHARTTGIYGALTLVVFVPLFILARANLDIAREIFFGSCGLETVIWLSAYSFYKK